MIASTVVSWITLLRAAESLKFSRVVPWDNDGLWFAEWKTGSFAPAHRNVVILANGSVLTTADTDV